MRSSRVSLRPATTQRSVSGTPASTSAWRTCQPHAVADRVGERRRAARAPAGRPRRAGAARRARPARPRASRDGRRPRRPAAGPGWPGRRRGRRRAERRGRPTWRSGPARGRRARCAGGRRASGRARRGRPRRRAMRSSRWRSRSGGPSGNGSASSTLVGSAAPARGAPCRTRRPAVSRRAWPSTHDAHAGGCAAAAGTWPLHPHDQQRQGVLARVRPARAGAPPRHVGVVDHRLVRLAPGAPAAPPDGLLVGTDGDPARRRGDGVGGREARRRAGRSPPPARSTMPRRRTLPRGCHGEPGPHPSVEGHRSVGGRETRPSILGWIAPGYRRGGQGYSHPHGRRSPPWRERRSPSRSSTSSGTPRWCGCSGSASSTGSPACWP